MHKVWKLILAVSAAAVLAAPSVSFACDYHGVTASVPSSQSVAEQPAPTPPAAPPSGNG